MRIGFMVGLFGLLSIGTPAEAQTVVRGQDVTVYKRRTTLVFGGVPVDGEPDIPAGRHVFVPGKPKFSDLIKLRANFTTELRKSVDQL